MNILSRIKKRFSKKEKTPRRVLIRQYNAASTSRLLGDWKRPQRSANAEIESAIRILRNGARDLHDNSDYARRFVNLLKTNVVGHSGIMLKPKVYNDDFKTLDATANAKISDGWRRFGKLGTFTVCGRYSYIDALKQIAHCVAVDGEAIVRIRRYSRSPFGIALQIIEADHLDETLNRTLDNGNQIKMGVEVDQFDRAVAYWLSKFHPGDKRFYSHSHKNKHSRIPASEILHLFITERPGQVRGITWLAPTEARVKMLDGFEEAALVAARVGASTMGVITSETGDEWDGDDPTLDEDGNETLEENEDVIFEAEPGQFKQLPKGFGLETWNPNQPNTAFSEFVKGILRGVASGLNVSYTNLANDLEGVSYSSIRQGEIQDRDNWRMIQVFMIEHFCDRIFARFLYEGMAYGAIKLPLFKYDRFNNPTWRARGWLWVDPDKESKAAQRDIGNMIESAEDIAARRGSDIFENIKENAAVNEAAENADLTVPAFNLIQEIGNDGNEGASTTDK